MSNVLYRFEAVPDYKSVPSRMSLNKTLIVLYEAGALDAHQWGYNPSESRVKMHTSPIIVGTFALADEAHAHRVSKEIREILGRLNTIISFEIKWYPEEFAESEWCFYQEDLDE